jgi:hypothetical protein
MSTSPDTSPDAARADDRIVSLLSHWLARHTSTAELRAELGRIETSQLSPAQAQALEEVLAELRKPIGHAGDLEMVVRETLEAVALG